MLLPQCLYVNVVSVSDWYPTFSELEKVPKKIAHLKKKKKKNLSRNNI